MDLSALIFVVLAVAWAGYLIPRALRHHEQVAASRPVDNFSDTMRVLERTPATMRALRTPPPATEQERAEVEKALTRADKRAKRDAALAEPHPVPRSVAHAAAVRRRRVLLMLLLVVAAVAGAAGLHYLSWRYVAVPGALVLGWLVLCRVMVRRASRRPVARPTRSVSAPTAATPAASESTAVPAVADPDQAYPLAHSVTTKDLETDGSLWDPLPLTLPTYVSKPAARRTVRTIDLTQVTSSGHDVRDSKLARDAEAQAATKKAEDTEPVRKVAGA